MRTLLLLLFTSLMYEGQTQMPHYGEKPPQEPGKCYAKCIIPQVATLSNDTLGPYMSKSEIPADLLEERLVTPAGTKWEKKLATKNCLSADPEDCMVWCLVTTDAEYSTPEIITTGVDGEEQLHVVTSLTEVSGGYTEWKEIICHNKVNKKLIKKIALSLNERGYSHPMPNRRMSSEMKEALIRFQKDNELPVGQLDLETLSFLEVY